MNSGILTDAVDSMDGDSTNYDNSYVEFLQNNLKNLTTNLEERKNE